MQNQKVMVMFYVVFFLYKNHLEIETVSTNINNAVFQGNHTFT
jgi:hypothetical protein